MEIRVLLLVMSPPIIYINVHVGTALYFGWTSCAAIVSGVSLLVYDVGLAMDISCYIGLVILLTVLIIWFSLETFAFDRQLRYIYDIDGNSFFLQLIKDNCVILNPKTTKFHYCLMMVHVSCLSFSYKKSAYINHRINYMFFRMGSIGQHCLALITTTKK